jgi:hypothetical protein
MTVEAAIVTSALICMVALVAGILCRRRFAFDAPLGFFGLAALVCGFALLVTYPPLEPGRGGALVVYALFALGASCTLGSAI